MYDCIIIGGGAAGFFTAVQLAEQRPEASILILEKSKEVLAKVKVSGGGRCNVTHAAFDPRDMVLGYPRGRKELRGPFHSFCSDDTMGFFEENGVPLKIEDDGRVFPESDSSQSIIDCLTGLAHNHGVTVMRQQVVVDLFWEENPASWSVITNSKTFGAKNVVVATGASPKVWKMIQCLGHSIVPPVPSLFTFNCKGSWVSELPGISHGVHLKIKHKAISESLEAEGPLLITHWGFSGPAVLKLSAWGARHLAGIDYQFNLFVDWVPEFSLAQLEEQLFVLRKKSPKKSVGKQMPITTPKRLWLAMLGAVEIDGAQTWGELSNKALRALANHLKESTFHIQGKSTFKEEFVTAGGVALKEIDFKTFSSKRCPGLYFAGEVLDIDAITGGYNFQNAWTGGYMVAQALAKDL
ncbi:BaiN/RdsA family NAD(P)/FAD-dependent oxidoreductase [Sediminicola luteus]|uniref:Flavoprotein n=1 Tax=Sediminicola luteus TaxID=319238 RepID=A0A2A4GBH2_9FLAO|nr:NAD(P)/FAD-dependent oxidoreductase [Sediminicola luteus]PCE65947.1 flavoprotein [Sediminicola luteus]